MSIEIISNSQVVLQNTPLLDNKSRTKSNYDHLLNQKDNSTLEEPVETSFKNMKISNQAIEQFLNDNQDEEGGKKTNKSKRPLLCTKCKGSVFYEQDELRKHFKTNWHNFNAKLSAQSKESLTAEEYDEYILMHPEVLK